MKVQLLVIFFLCLAISLSYAKNDNDPNKNQQEYCGFKKPNDMDNRDWKRLLRMVARGKERNVPIQFYGKITDQNSAPVAGVDVFVSVRGFNERLIQDALAAKEKGISPEGFLDQKETYLSLQSDPNGLFCIENMSGYSLNVEFLKEGYLSPQGKKYFYPYKKEKICAFQKKESPEVLQIRRLSEIPPELVKNQIRTVLPEPNVYYIDLLGKRIVNAKDANDFICKYTIKKSDEKAKVYDWAFEIEATEGGGISETNEIFMFRAPEKYQKKFSFTMSKNEKFWTDSLQKSFYIKSKKGKQYANINIDVAIKRDGRAFLYFENFINSSGSTDLERIPLVDRKSYDEYIKRQINKKREHALTNPVEVH